MTFSSHPLFLTLTLTLNRLLQQHVEYKAEGGGERLACRLSQPADA